MSQKKKPRKNVNEKNTPNATIIVALLALFGTLITAFFNSPVLLALIQRTPEPAPTEIPAMTAFVKTPTFAPTKTFTPTSTATSVPPTPTCTPVSPPMDCLDRWDFFSSAGTLSVPPEASGQCQYIQVKALGLTATEGGLAFARSNIRSVGVDGISMPVPLNATIRFSVEVRQLISGEFWIGFSEEIDPQANALVFALTAVSGDVRIYPDPTKRETAKYRWTNLEDYIKWQEGAPKVYEFEIVLLGNTVSTKVNGVPFSSETAASTERLFFGYRARPDSMPTYLNVIVSDLAIQSCEGSSP